MSSKSNVCSHRPLQVDRVTYFEFTEVGSLQSLVGKPDFEPSLLVKFNHSQAGPVDSNGITDATVIQDRRSVAYCERAPIFVEIDGQDRA